MFLKFSYSLYFLTILFLVTLYSSNPYLPSKQFTQTYSETTFCRNYETVDENHGIRFSSGKEKWASWKLNCPCNHWLFNAQMIFILINFQTEIIFLLFCAGNHITVGGTPDLQMSLDPLNCVGAALKHVSSHWGGTTQNVFWGGPSTQLTESSDDWRSCHPQLISG